MPRPQAGVGALQEMRQIDLMRPITRAAVSVWNAQRLEYELSAAVSAAVGESGAPGPVFFEIPTDVLRELVTYIPISKDVWSLSPSRNKLPDSEDVAHAVDMLWSASRIL